MSITMLWQKLHFYRLVNVKGVLMFWKGEGG